jgi:hypothetical protein
MSLVEIAIVIATAAGMVDALIAQAVIVARHGWLKKRPTAWVFAGHVLLTFRPVALLLAASAVTVATGSFSPMSAVAPSFAVNRL